MSKTQSASLKGSKPSRSCRQEMDLFKTTQRKIKKNSKTMFCFLDSRITQLRKRPCVFRLESSKISVKETIYYPQKRSQTTLELATTALRNLRLLLATILRATEDQLASIHRFKAVQNHLQRESLPICYLTTLKMS